MFSEKISYDEISYDEILAFRKAIYHKFIDLKENKIYIIISKYKFQKIILLLS